MEIGLTNEELIAICIAGIIGILVGDNARKYGMNPIGWGAFVFLIMIVGLPTYFIVRSRREKIDEE